MEWTPEMRQRGVECATPAELLTRARAEGIPMTEEEARDCFAKLHPPAEELSDEELENVNAGMAADIGTGGPFHSIKETVTKGEHSTVVLTCGFCKHQGIMDRYIYTYYGVDGPNSVTTDRVQICRNCGIINEWGKPASSSGGC